MRASRASNIRLLVAAGLVSSGLVLAPGALAQAAGNPATIASCQYTSDNTHPLAFCSTGQTANISVPANASVSYKFDYPGDNSNLTVWASVNPMDPLTASAVGVNVFDNAKPATPPVPVETVTTQTNQANSDPHQMQFNYSAGPAGPVTLQFFNGTSNSVTFSMNDSGLVTNSSSGSVTNPVVLYLLSAPGSVPAASPASPAAPAAAAPAAAAPAAPAVAGAPGKPSTIASCQYISDNTHPLPFCSTGQVANVTVPPSGSVNYQFAYPGDNSNITFTSTVNPIDPMVASAIGVNVYDANSSKLQPPAPVEIVTTLTNQANNDPHQMQFNYSSGTAGPVTLQLFNYSQNAVTFGLNDSGLVVSTGNGSTTTPVTLQLT